MADADDNEVTSPGIDPRRGRRRAISESAARDQVEIVLIELEYAETPEGRREVLKAAFHRVLERGRGMGRTDLEQAHSLARQEQTQRQTYELELHDLRYAVMAFLRSDMAAKDVADLKLKLYGSKP